MNFNNKMNIYTICIRVSQSNESYFVISVRSHCFTLIAWRSETVSVSVLRFGLQVLLLPVLSVQFVCFVLKSFLCALWLLPWSDCRSVKLFQELLISCLLYLNQLYYQKKKKRHRLFLAPGEINLCFRTGVEVPSEDAAVLQWRYSQTLAPFPVKAQNPESSIGKEACCCQVREFTKSLLHFSVFFKRSLLFKYIYM